MRILIRSADARDCCAPGRPMQVERRWAVMLVLAGAGLSGCTAADDASQAVPSSVPSLPTPAPPTPSPAPVPVPVARDDGYADAVATFGEARVQQAVAD